VRGVRHQQHEVGVRSGGADLIPNSPPRPDGVSAGTTLALVDIALTGIPVDVLGLFTLPDLVPHDEDLFGRLRQMHDWLGVAMAALVCLHAAAALRHHFIPESNS
jgi:hypothetical protein